MSTDLALKSAVSLSEALALPLPTLPPLPSTTVVTGTGTSVASRVNGEDNAGGPGSLWADDEERRFYTDLLDLRGEVPGSLLKAGAAGTAEDSKDVTKAEFKDDMEEKEEEAPSDLE